jgi:hypothetical protein
MILVALAVNYKGFQWWRSFTGTAQQYQYSYGIKPRFHCHKCSSPVKVERTSPGLFYGGNVTVAI